MKVIIKGGEYNGKELELLSHIKYINFPKAMPDGYGCITYTFKGNFTEDGKAIFE